MYSLAQLFQGINECYPIIDSVLSSLQNTNRNNLSISQVNATFDSVRKTTDKLDKVVKLINGATQVLPNYLSFLQGKQNQLQSSINRLELIVTARNVIDPKSVNITNHFVIWEKGNFGIKVSNSMIAIRTELTSIKSLLRVMERKLK